MTYANVPHLGFWSGRTGGLSLTGTDRPDTGEVEGPGHLTKDQRHQAKAERLDGPGEGRAAAHRGRRGRPAERPAEHPASSSFGVPGQSYVSVHDQPRRRSPATRSACSSPARNGITITDTTVENSLEDGVVMHRFASSAVIERTCRAGNGGDGFVLSRATEQVRVSGSTARAQRRQRVHAAAARRWPRARRRPASRSASYGSNSVSNSVGQATTATTASRCSAGSTSASRTTRSRAATWASWPGRAADKVAITGNQLRGAAAARHRGAGRR